MKSSGERTSLLNVKKISKNLKSIINGLPEKSEIIEITNSIKVISDLLYSYKKLLESVPARENFVNLEKELTNFEKIFEEFLNTKTSKLISKNRRSYSSSPSFTDDELIIAEKELKYLESLPIDDIKSRLTNTELFKMKFLKAIAIKLGLKTTSNVKRESLIHQISMKIANFRGYKQLSGETNG